VGTGAGAVKKNLSLKTLVLGMVLFSFIGEKAWAQSAGEALDALKLLQQKCESGISYQDYGPALDQVRKPVLRYLASAGSKSSPGFSGSLGKALTHYEYAGKVMRLRTDGNGYFLSSQDPGLFDFLKKTYPELNVIDQKGTLFSL
jgi:hypothetical protein